MFSENMRAVYKRLSVLSLLCACLLAFGSGAVTESVTTGREARSVSHVLTTRFVSGLMDYRRVFNQPSRTP
jgi:hypothetical protein